MISLIIFRPRPAMVHAAPRGVPLDVVLDVADDQRRLLLENSKLQRSRNADCSALGFLLLLLVPWEQAASRFCRLSTLFAFLSGQACVSSFCNRSCSDSGRNSVVVFSCAKARRPTKRLTVQLAGPIDAMPLWGLFIAILVVVLLSVECG
jgi:hypothetical protein